MSQKKGMETLQRTQESRPGPGWGQGGNRRRQEESTLPTTAFPRGGAEAMRAKGPRLLGSTGKPETLVELECVTLTGFTPTDDGEGVGAGRSQQAEPETAKPACPWC